MINIVIYEDEEKDADALRLLIEKYFLEINCTGNITIYKNGDAFLEDFAANKLNDVKIVFLDIFMPGTNGIDTARKLREKDKNMVVIITTTSKNHGLEGSAFLRTHRSFIVNIPYIKDIAENDFILINGTLIPIRQNDKLTVKQAYMDYVFAYTRGERS